MRGEPIRSQRNQYRNMTFRFHICTPENDSPTKLFTWQINSTGLVSGTNNFSPTLLLMTLELLKAFGLWPRTLLIRRCLHNATFFFSHLSLNKPGRRRNRVIFVTSNSHLMAIKGHTKITAPSWRIRHALCRRRRLASRRDEGRKLRE